MFTNVLSEPDAAGPADAGWEAGLEVVEAQLEGTPITWNPLDRAEELARRTSPRTKEQPAQPRA